MLIGDGDLDKKSDVSAHEYTRRNRPARKSVWVGRVRPSIIEKVKEHKLELHTEQNEELNIERLYQSYYTHFAPQIWLWTCRGTVFLWVYAYHDFQSWALLFWLMHSTLFKSTRAFIHITVTYYLPVFATVFLFYYVINIPRVVEFPSLTDLERWRTFGFYQFSIPPLEVGLMLGALVPFFMLIKTRKQLDLNSKEDSKKKFLEKLTSEKSSTFYYFAFVVLTNLDLLAFVVIFFSGVNKIDFYHVFLLFFFVAYILWPTAFVRNYVVLLLYVDFFVFEKYLYTLIVEYIPKDSWFLPVAEVLGLSTEYNDVSTASKLFPFDILKSTFGTHPSSSNGSSSSWCSFSSKCIRSSRTRRQLRTTMD